MRRSHRWGHIVAITLGLLAGCLGRLETRATPLGTEHFAPSFSLSSHTGEQVAMSELVSTGPAVIVFYRGHW